MIIRAAGACDVARIVAVDHLADARFRDVGMAAVADGPVMSEAAVAQHIATGWVWVAVERGEVVGFLAGEPADGAAHVLQVSSLPQSAGRRVGALLLDAYERRAASAGLSTMTLTTFRYVPWNRPYYERLGWRVVPPDGWGPQMRRIRQAEADAGLDAWPRCVMAKSVTHGELLR